MLPKKCKQLPDEGGRGGAKIPVPGAGQIVWLIVTGVVPVFACKQAQIKKPVQIYKPNNMVMLQNTALKPAQMMQ